MKRNELANDNHGRPNEEDETGPAQTIVTVVGTGIVFLTILGVLLAIFGG